MPIKSYNVPPYYDDFDQTKNYMRILFQPGYSVQARELTQLQTALQAQIDRFGSSIYKDGTAPIGGQATFDNQYGFVKLYSSFTYAEDASPISGFTDGAALVPDNYYSELVGRIITGHTSGITATVLETAASGSGDPLTLFVKYHTTGTDNASQTFLPNEYLYIAPKTASLPARLVQTKQLNTIDTVHGDAVPAGYGSRVYLNEGVFYVAGNFVYSPSQSIIVSKYSTTPSARVVFIIAENIVTFAQDLTLTDNALGSPNASAPGADRYQIKLTLNVQPASLEDRNEDNIIQLMVIKNGIVSSVARTELSTLGDTLAQRTYEESGNYTVNPFLLNIKEYLDNGTNGGLYTVAQIVDQEGFTGPTANADATAYGEAKLAVGLEASTAYVYGYRIQTVDTKYVAVDKARDEGYVHETSVTANLGNYIVIDTLVGLPDVNTYTAILLKDSGSSAIGTCRARSIQDIGSGKYNLYIFDVVMYSGKTFAQTATLYCSYGYGGAAFTAAVLNSGTIFDPVANQLLYRLPKSAVSSLRTFPGGLINTLYEVRARYDSRTIATGAIQLTASTNEFFDSANSNDWVIVDNGGTRVPTSAYSASLGAGGATITFTFSGSGAPGNGTVCYLVGPSRRNFREKTKTLHAGTQVNLSGSGLNTVSGGYDSLGYTDVISISGIYMSASPSTPAVITDLNVTDRYYLDNGQRDNFYDVSRIQLKPGASAPTGQILVVFSYLSHGAGDYFSVDSYTGQVAYEDIGTFQASTGAFRLTDVLDFRPTKDTTGANFSGTRASTVSMIAPNTIITLDIQYYFSRADKLYVDKKGNFGVQRGIASDKAVPASDVKDAMILYNLQVNAYTLSPKDVVPALVDNRRYTMRDIGTVDNRLKSMEYYVSLSLAESQAAGTQLYDSNTNTPYYKNGFVVDSFVGSSTGSVTHPDYSVSIDRIAQYARPTFSHDNVKLIFNAAASSNFKRTGSLVTLDYSELEYFNQPYASQSISVQPFEVFNWTGKIDLSPNEDEWKDTQQVPDVVIDNNGAYAAMVNTLDQTNAFGTVWNEWTTNWVGSTTVSPAGQVMDDDRDGWGSMPSSTTSTTITTTNQSRTATTKSLSSSTNTRTVGDYIVDVSFVPFIRSRLVYFQASSLKPNTRVYAFFDSKDINSYVRQVSSPGAGWWDSVQYYNNSTPTTYAGATAHPSGSTPLIADASGNIFGSFLIPSNSSVMFKTGARIFRLTDSPTNNVVNATTYAEASYTAQGLLNTSSNLVISTKTPVITTSQVSESRTFETSVSNVNEGLNLLQYRRDPLAQTFRIDLQGGAMLTSIDLYFQSVDSTASVTVDIRTVENGFPTQNIVPFSTVTVQAADISVDDTTANSATKFTFPSPVLLLGGVEYAFVVQSKSSNYKLWVSNLGEYDVTTPSFRITKQPFAGVLFESANQSTWTPDQTRDIKFKIRRASFVSAGSVVLNEATVPARNLENDALYFTASSGTVRVYHPNHGMFVGSNVTLSGIAPTSSTNVNGIPVASLNTTLSVVSVEIDSYTVVATSGTANATGRAGGSAIYATENRAIDVLHPIIGDVVTPYASSVWSTKLTSGRSLAGTEAPYIIGDYVPAKVNDDMLMTNPQTILSAAEIPQLSDSGAKSFYLKSVLSTTLSNVSPIIDLDRTSLITVSNRIDNPLGSSSSGYNQVENYLDETNAIGGSSLAKYVTKQISLANPSTGLTIYLGVNRPAAASVAVYYKVLRTGHDEEFNSIGWFLVNPVAAIGINNNPAIYDEVSYVVQEADLKAQFGVSDEVTFTSFAVKVVFTSINSSKVATIRSFRAIAVY